MTETPGNGTGQLHVHGIPGQSKPETRTVLIILVLSFPANQTWKATWRPSPSGDA